MAVASVGIEIDARGAVQQLKAVNTQSQQLQTAVNGATAAVTKQGRELLTATNGMRYFYDAAGKARAENGRFLSTAERAAAGIRNQGQAAQAAARNMQQLDGASKGSSSALDSLGGIVGKLGIAFSTIGAAKFIFAKTAEIETQTRSIQVLTGSVEQAKQIVQELQQLGAVTPFTSTELIDSAKRLQAFGVQAKDVVDTTRKLADVAGATGAELDGLVTAYGQVQAKGRLQGEELLQFQERGIALQGELRKMYGLSGEEFQKALSKGQISAQAVEVAITRLTEKGGKYANGAIAQSDTLAGKLSTLQDGIDQVARAIGTNLTPALKGALDVAIDLVTRMGQAFAASSISEDFKQRVKRETEASITRDFGVMPGGAFGAGEIQMKFGGKIYRGQASSVLSDITNAKINAEVNRRAQLNMPPPQPRRQAQTTPPPLLTPTAPSGGGGTTGGKGKADDKAKATAEEQKRVADIIRNRMAEAELIRVKSTAQDKIAQAEAVGDKQLAIRLQGQLRAIDLQYQYAQQLAQEKDIRAQTAIIYEGNTALVANQFETQRQLNEAQRQADQDRLNALQAVIEKQYQMNTAVQQQLQFADSVANSIGQGMTSAFDALIRGSDDWGKSLQSIASGVLVDIANQLIKIYVIEQAINAIKTFLTPFAAGTPMGAGGGQVGRFGTFGPNYGIPQFANGGSIKANQLSLVGERGPELFMPGRSGTIIPNHNLGGGGISVVVNVDASGSSVSGDQAQGKQLGMAVSAAVQAELLKQKRPGGLLA